MAVVDTIHPKDIEEMVREREAQKEEKRRSREEKKKTKERQKRSMFLEKLVAPVLFLLTVCISFFLYLMNL